MQLVGTANWTGLHSAYTHTHSVHPTHVTESSLDAVPNANHTYKTDTNRTAVLSLTFCSRTQNQQFGELPAVHVRALAQKLHSPTLLYTHQCTNKYRERQPQAFSQACKICTTHTSMHRPFTLCSHTYPLMQLVFGCKSLKYEWAVCRDVYT